MKEEQNATAESSSSIPAVRRDGKEEEDLLLLPEFARGGKMLRNFARFSQKAIIIIDRTTSAQFSSIW